jgi:hypothetical protein
LASELFHHVRREKISESQCGSTVESHVSARIREIACHTLMLSEGELDDFFKEEPSDSDNVSKISSKKFVYLQNFQLQENPKQFTNLVMSTAKSKVRVQPT